jgi:hypothetical protein
MALPKTFNPSVEGATIRFLGFDLNGKPRTYMLRVKTGQSATDLVEAMLKEVEAANKE